MSIGISTPTPDEVKDQLRRMLASKRFKNASKQSQFLKLVVERALKGKQTGGSDIAEHLFPGSLHKTAKGTIQVVGTDVRTAAFNLRRTLKQYRAEEGQEDSVVISLPEPPKDSTLKLREGEPYTPQFAYNPMHFVANELKLGNHFHRRGEIEDEELAFRHFVNALDYAPHHVDAAIGVIESFCVLTDWDAEIYKDLEKQEWLVKACELIIDSIYSHNSRYWRIYAVMGCLKHKGRRADANESFGKAKMLDRARTESYWPYLQFLLDSGQKTEALRLSKRHLDHNQDDICAYLRYGSALLVSEQYPEAEEIFERALGIDKSNTFVRYYVAQLRIWRLRNEDALPHQAILKALSDDRTFAVGEKLIKEYSQIVEEHIRSGCVMKLQ